MPALLEYLDTEGRSPYATWFSRLSPNAAAKVTVAVYRLEAGNFSNVKAVGKGVFERKVDFGPGYRVYFGRDGAEVVILLGGSSKQDQREAIALAQARWEDYKRRKGMRHREQ